MLTRVSSPLDLVLSPANCTLTSVQDCLYFICLRQIFHGKLNHLKLIRVVVPSQEGPISFCQNVSSTTCAPHNLIRSFVRGLRPLAPVSTRATTIAPSGI